MKIDEVTLVCEMKRQHLTSLELARKSFLSPTTVQSARNGRRIGKNSAKRIAAALGVALESLIVESEG